VVDYIGRWLGGKFISSDYLDGEVPGGDPTGPVTVVTPEAKAPVPVTVMKVPEPEASTRPRAAIDDAPSCSECGMLMTPNGSCYKCSNCGSTSGCS
jgi:ribonucleoside-diphosphate reductase alpha chain